MSDYKDYEERTYKHNKETLDKMLEGPGIPNVKGFEKEIRDVNKRLKLLEAGAQLPQSAEQLESAYKAMARLRGQQRALKETLASIKARIKEVCK